MPALTYQFMELGSSLADSNKDEGKEDSKNKLQRMMTEDCCWNHLLNVDSWYWTR